jgi:hypothetical protein
MKKLITIAIFGMLIASVAFGAVYTWHGNGSIQVDQKGWWGLGAIDQYDTFSVSTYYTGSLDSVFLVNDSAGVAPIEFSDTFSFAPADADSFVIPDTMVIKTDKIVITTTGMVILQANHSSATKFYLEADMVYTIYPDRQIRKYIFTAVESTGVTASAINNKFNE